MSNLIVQGLISARKKELRNQAERQHHINNELQTVTWTKEDKAGRCYTYRGVQYCYNWMSDPKLTLRVFFCLFISYNF